MDPVLDYENYSNVNNPRARQTVIRIKEIENYVDIWRQINENKRGFTWRRLNPNRKQSRLDYFLISSSLANFATNSSIVPGYRSDHSGISLTLQFSKNDRGKGYWKFNNSLLKDENYISLFKTVLNNLVNLHKINQNVNNDSYENIILDINDQLFLETFLVTLRGETIKFSSHKKWNN
jgi:hypothetical protein